METGEHALSRVFGHGLAAQKLAPGLHVAVDVPRRILTGVPVMSNVAQHKPRVSPEASSASDADAIRGKRAAVPDLQPFAGTDWTGAPVVSTTAANEERVILETVEAQMRELRESVGLGASRTEVHRPLPTAFPTEHPNPAIRGAGRPTERAALPLAKVSIAVPASWSDRAHATEPTKPRPWFAFVAIGVTVVGVAAAAIFWVTTPSAVDQKSSEPVAIASDLRRVDTPTAPLLASDLAAVPSSPAPPLGTETLQPRPEVSAAVPAMPSGGASATNSPVATRGASAAKPSAPETLPEQPARRAGPATEAARPAAESSGDLTSRAAGTEAGPDSSVAPAADAAGARAALAPPPALPAVATVPGAASPSMDVETGRADSAGAQPAGPRSTNPTAAPPAAGEVSSSAAITRAPVLVTRGRVTYPDVARRMGVTGDVDVDADIDIMGRVVRATSVAGPPVLRSAAEAAVLQFRYQPAMSDGVVVTSRQRVRVTFK